MNNRRLLAITLLAVLAAAVPLSADEGKIPVFERGALTEPGHYILTRDITISSSHGISIADSADNLVLDLGGHTFKSTSTSGYLIVLSSGATHVTIKNGRLEGGQNAIRYYSTSYRVHLVIDNVEIIDPSDYGVFVNGAEHVEVTNCRFSGSSSVSNAIYVDGDNEDGFTGRFHNNTISEVGGHAIRLDGLNTGEISNNSIYQYALTNHTSYGIYVNCSSNGWGCYQNCIVGNRIRSSLTGVLIENAIYLEDLHRTLIRDNVTDDDLDLNGVGGNFILENSIRRVNLTSCSGTLIENNRLGVLNLGSVGHPENVYRDNYITTSISGSGVDGGGNIITP